MTDEVVEFDYKGEKNNCIDRVSNERSCFFKYNWVKDFHKALGQDLFIINTKQNSIFID